jgi:uncharacterized protein (TIGR00725 family)
MKLARKSVAIVGASDAGHSVCELAHRAGVAVARRGAVLICGGRGGVMAAAARGAQSADGVTVGILPGYDRRQANANIEIVIATGMGEARNAIVVASADTIVALQGEGGTLSEIGLAIKLGRPVVALQAWHQLEMIAHADDPVAAVDLALELAGRQSAAEAGQVRPPGSRSALGVDRKRQGAARRGEKRVNK